METQTLQSKHQLVTIGISRMMYLTLLTFLLVQVSIAQTVHTVDNRPESGAMYTTVTAAITAAVTGDIIHIHPSPTTYGSFTINKGLTVMGLGHNPVNADGVTSTVGTISLAGIADDTVIHGLYVTGNISGYYNSTRLHDVKIVNNRIGGFVQGSAAVGRTDNWIIEGNFFTGGGTDIYGYASANWRISNNWMNGVLSSLINTTVIINNIFIYGTTSGKAIVFYSCNSPIVANNIFLLTSLATGIGLNSSTVNFQNCMTYSYTATTLDALGDGTGGNIDNTDPLFTNVPVNSISDFYNNDYSLTAGSAGKGAGTDTTDLGIYGRLFDFDPNGRPDLTPYPTFINITNTVIAPGQSLNIEFKGSIKQ